VQALIILQLGVMIFMRGPVTDLWVLYYTLQIICYLTIYDSRMPANAEIFLHHFTKVIMFDIANPERWIQIFAPNFTWKGLIFGIHKPKLVLSSDQEISMIDDLMVYFQALVYSMIAVGVLTVMAKVCKAKENGKLSRARKYMFFNGLIRLVTVVYLQACISFSLQLEMWMRSSEYQDFPEKLMALLMMLFAISAPALSYWLLKR
jgi:hypothetical protein